MPHHARACAVALLSSVFAIAPVRADVPAAHRLRQEGEALLRQALSADTPGPLYARAMERFYAARDELEAELRVKGDDPALEREVQDLNSMVFFCHRNLPATEEDRPEPEAQEPLAEDQAQTLFEEAAAFEREGRGTALATLARYVEVAERTLGTPWCMKAQRRALDLQRKLLASPAPAAEPKPERPQVAAEPEHVLPQAPDEEPVQAPASLADRLTQLLGCAAKDLPGGRVQLDFDFRDPLQGKWWHHYDGEWRLARGFLSGQRRTQKRVAANNWLMVVFEGDVEAEVVAKALGRPDGINLALHASGDDVGYGVSLGGNKNTTLYGFRNLTFKRKMALKSGKTYRIEYALKGSKLTYEVNGRTLWKGSDPAPLGRGRLRISTNGRIVVDRVRVVGRPSEAWLSEQGITP